MVCVFVVYGNDLLVSDSEIHRAAVGKVLMWHGSALITHSDLQRAEIGRSDGGPPQRSRTTIDGIIAGGIALDRSTFVGAEVVVGYASIALIDAHGLPTHDQLYLPITYAAVLLADHSGLDAQQSASDGSCVPTEEQQLSCDAGF